MSKKITFKTNTPHPSIANAGLLVVLHQQRAIPPFFNESLMSDYTNLRCSRCTPFFPLMRYRRTTSAVVLFGFITLSAMDQMLALT